MRGRWAYAAAALGLAAGVVISWPLWGEGRDYPLAPLFPGLFGLASWPALALLGVSVAGLPFQRRLGPLALAAAAFLVLQDQSRLQPWFYEYVSLALLLAWARSPRGAQLLVVALYAYSGAHKLSFGFARDTAVWLMGPVPGAAALGWGAPWLEMAWALGLLWPRTRRPAVVGIAAMHALILAALVAHRWNAVVWPWNLAMPVIVAALFWNERARPAEVLWGEPWRVRGPVLALFGILPALSFAGWWDDALSFALYSGTQLFGDVRMGGSTVYLDAWSERVLRVPAYPAARVLKQVARTFCARGEPTLVLRRKSGPLYSAGERTEISYTELCR